MTRYFTFLAAAACAAVTLHAQDNPLSAGNKYLYSMIKANLIKAAQKMPEENYSFKPTPEVRSFGQIVGHVADAQYLFCTAVKGDKKESDIEKTKTSKADLVAALQEAFTYCDAVYNAMTDAAAPAKLKFFGQDATKLGVLSFNVAHDNEHYGNIVTYMRLKGLVPPSSESSSQ
jgi:uncharacterized damage-inducible protein DinB